MTALPDEGSRRRTNSILIGVISLVMGLPLACFIGYLVGSLTFLSIRGGDSETAGYIGLFIGCLVTPVAVVGAGLLSGLAWVLHVKHVPRAGQMIVFVCAILLLVGGVWLLSRSLPAIAYH
jgi:hypothetical protein